MNPGWPKGTVPFSLARKLRQSPAAACGLLVLAVALVFGQTTGSEFVNYDDDVYVSRERNPRVAGGLAADGIEWAFTTRYAANWHPVTWLSHMLDCEIYGLRPAGHHLTSVLLHAATAVLLLVVLRRMTGRLWPSALAAAVFALHPLRAESVAWVAERKDVLSGLFFMLTLMAYLGYARRPFSMARYLAVLGCFALGLMAKPMLVTLPLVLLLLDYWPLGRLSLPKGTVPFSSNENRDSPPLVAVVIEKIPLLAMAAASCVVTLWAQSQAIVPVDFIPWSSRLANVPSAYLGYLREFFYPAGLAAFYPYPAVAPAAWQTIGAVLVLAAVTVAACLARRRCPYLLVGWFWYLGMLVPVIGVVQVGGQAMADRYTYLPEIGVSIAAVWAVDALGRLRPLRGACAVAAAVVLAIFMGLAWRQTAYWHDSVALWTRDVACTEPTALGHLNLGRALKQQGRLEEAVDEYRRGLDLKPDAAEGHNNLGVALAMLGRMDEAVAEFRIAVALNPGLADAQRNLKKASR